MSFFQSQSKDTDESDPLVKAANVTDIHTLPSLPRLSNDGVAILLFHGVIPDTTYAVRNYTGKHISARSFEMVLQKLADSGNPVSMDEVARHVAGVERCRPRSFAVTFDDGFRNNLTIAAPILRQLGIPTTFYVTADFIDNDASSWVDRIEAAVEHTPLQSIRGPMPVSNLYPLSDTRQRIAFMSEVRRMAKADLSLDLDTFADELVAQLIGDSTITREDLLDSKLSWHEVRMLATDDLFTIGGHGTTHRILGFLSDDESTVEIDQSLLRLRDEVAPATLHYSYPEGFPGSYTEREALRLADWKSATAVTTTPGYVSPGDAALELNRFFIA